MCTNNKFYLTVSSIAFKQAKRLFLFGIKTEAT